MSDNLSGVLLPTNLGFAFGNLKINAEGVGGMFIIDKELEDDLECSEIIVLVGNDSDGNVIDTIPREISLKKGDTLHFEYSIDVKFG